MVMARHMGIADCHGIESFMPVKGHDRDAFVLLLRAQTNRQRHAVFYVVNINEGVARRINEELAKKNRECYIKALNILKTNTVPNMNLSFPRQFNAEKSWKLIPNPDLDPWG